MGKSVYWFVATFTALLLGEAIIYLSPTVEMWFYSGWLCIFVGFSCAVHWISLLKKEVYA